jgi:raffinose/stachyose/melibiose transport system substrate-binding protein
VALQRITSDMVFDDPCLLRAGQGVRRLLDAQPFQEGFLGAPAQQAAGSSAGLIATGQAAMELQGHWNGSTITDLTPDGQPLGDRLGWFPFPAVPGGQGNAAATFGGGDGFSCSSEAPPRCADFLAFLVNAENQRAFVPTQVGLPTNPDALDAVTDPTVKGVLEARAAAPYNQLYFDKALPTAVGEALNSEIARMFAGQATPESILQVATDAAASEQ